MIDTTDPVITKPITDAVKKWRYTPARDANGPVGILWERRIVFATKPGTAVNRPINHPMPGPSITAPVPR